jgi:hypothetical protein
VHDFAEEQEKIPVPTHQVSSRIRSSSALIPKWQCYTAFNSIAIHRVLGVSITQVKSPVRCTRVECMPRVVRDKTNALCLKVN